MLLKLSFWSKNWKMILRFTAESYIDKPRNRLKQTRSHLSVLVPFINVQSQVKLFRTVSCCRSIGNFPRHRLEDAFGQLILGEDHVAWAVLQDLTRSYDILRYLTSYMSTWDSVNCANSANHMKPMSLLNSLSLQPPTTSEKFWSLVMTY